MYLCVKDIDVASYYDFDDSRDRMVVGFTTTYTISDYHHLCCEFESRSGQGVQHIPESGVKHHQANKQLCLCNNIYMKAR